MKTNLNKDWVNKAVKLYQIDKMSLEKIAKELNINTNTVYYHIKKVIKLRTKQEAITKTFTHEEIRAIINKYNNSISLDDLSKEFNTSHRTIKKILIESGVSLRTRTENSTKYNKDFNFFENPHLWEQKHAYFLGWLMSDGHHNVKKRQIQIRLQERDRRILEILKGIIGYTGPINFLKRTEINDFIKKSTKKWQHRYSLVVNHAKITEDLLKLKIDNNKTNNLEFPTYLRKDLISHYLRSFYEGDGTISYSMYQNGKRIKFAINVIATQSFILTLKNFLKNELNIESQILIDDKIKNGNVILRFAGKLNSLKFFNYVYKDAKFVLKRKFRKFLKLINHIKRENEDSRLYDSKRVLPELNKAILIAKDIIQNAEY